MKAVYSREEREDFAKHYVAQYVKSHPGVKLEAPPAELSWRATALFLDILSSASSSDTIQSKAIVLANPDPENKGYANIRKDIIEAMIKSQSQKTKSVISSVLAILNVRK